ncbi:sigma-54-dependent Fis family transcriptional regulator [Nitrogeniibacter mangrovi]|uniref:Sigma-54-dependent Fis family transcriptional regulator n=1 Tax=Nitrogeniibacter mangrovi TaxID=2016596 RepID=A0A6C1B6A0_9RHOO|nr:sigma-54-dependent Fis family transcriptional regulator [Nitrogeniibacter mangrovi]QID19252.1 sigma-54-dependent Fis family transcriptional regulator [Nitrogeniibacter mangrovi]
MLDALIDVARQGHDVAGHIPRELPGRLALSRRRSMTEHRLDAGDRGEADVLTDPELAHLREEHERLLRVAVPGLDWLHRQLGDLGFCLLLTDFSGATLETRAVDRRAGQFASSGLRAGACWSEQIQGTCGVGTAIVDQAPVLVHGQQHYLVRNHGITCAAVPLFGPEVKLLGVLNATACAQDAQKFGQGLAYRLTQQTAVRIEQSLFMEHFAEHWIARVRRQTGHWDDDPDVLIAFDESGHVVGASRQLSQRLGRRDWSIEALLNQSVDGLIDFARAHPGAPMHLAEPSGDDTLSAMIRAPRRVRRAGPARAAAARRPAPGDGLRRLEMLANSKVPILLLGETGSGKELTAKAIHARSRRHDQPFVAINCAAIPENLIESELFGYREGAFTGARARGSVGKIAQADGGTLFLDEIGDMPLGLQTRLLRVLAEGEVLALGAATPQVVDIQIICATHRDLEAMVRAGQFREDLYYRLNAATHRLPPLRERDDKPALIRKVLAEECAAAGKSVVLSDAVEAALLAHPWPGNIRELRNVLRYAIAVCLAPALDWADLPETFRATVAAEEGDRRRVRLGGGETASVPERDRIVQALERTGGCASAASRALGVSRSTLYRRLRQYGIRLP